MRECFFCKSNIKEADWKETELLKRYTSASAKIVPKNRRGICTKHQRKVARAIRRARVMALLPYVTK
ncbi:MAG: 30S ribosomal protein S18 [bacterium]|nr:30S ribosomal protein S18 [bacterium]